MCDNGVAMRSKLILGSAIKLENDDFKIIDYMGEGANSEVYLAECTRDGSRHIIKEFNPTPFDLNRESDGTFITDDLVEDERTKYHYRKSLFLAGAKNQIAIRSNYQVATNYTLGVYRIYQAFNTIYVDMPIYQGSAYDQVKEESLYATLLHVKAIAVAVCGYHKSGFLHLDLKPSNIFVMDNVYDLVYIFDFDSVISKEELTNSYISISYSKEWAAPEVLDPENKPKISEASDIFSIGEILFYKIFGRNSSVLERSIFSDYDYEESSLCKGVNPKALYIITSIFHRAICLSVNARMTSCEELVKGLDEAIELCRPGSMYILPSRVLAKEYFVGRDDIIKMIDYGLQKTRVVVLH